MRGRTVLRTIRLGGWDPELLRSGVLALLFLAGALAGHLYAGAWSPDTRRALEQYLSDYPPCTTRGAWRCPCSGAR